MTAIENADRLREEFDSMAKRLAGRQGPRFAIQKHVEVETEVIVGASRAAALGPMVMFGLGGIHVEVLRDVVFKLAPLSRHEAQGMIHGIRGAKILDGVRGRPAADKEKLVDLLLRVSCLVSDHPEIAELDLNPVSVAPPGRPTRVLDYRIRIDRK